MTHLNHLNARIDAVLALKRPPWRQQARRLLLGAASVLLPDRTARTLARRHLSTAHGFLDELARTKPRFDIIPIDDRAAILRPITTAARSGRPRILVVPGHDGHFRQFTRLLGALHHAGCAPDLLALPGHTRAGEDLCTIPEIVTAIEHAFATMGPYDGIVAHCISGNAALFALDKGLHCPRLALISVPLDLRRLAVLGGTQYGLSGAMLERFVMQIDRLFAPYSIDHPWRPIAVERLEPILAVHACTDYAAPIDDVRRFVDLAQDARIVEFEQGDHNGILNVKAAVREVSAFFANPAQGMKRPAPLEGRTGSAALGRAGGDTGFRSGPRKG